MKPSNSFDQERLELPAYPAITPPLSRLSIMTDGNFEGSLIEKQARYGAGKGQCKYIFAQQPTPTC